MRILVLEDYAPLRRSILECLSEENYTVDATDSGREALWYAENHNYDALLLDIMVPEMSGLEVLEKLRGQGKKVPVIIISAKDSVAQRVEGLEMGADDYLIKPFALEEMIARVRAQIRRQHEALSPILQIGELSIDTTCMSVQRAGKEIHLTRKEYRLLECLAYRKDEVVSREYIGQHAYEDYEGGTSNTVDVYVGYLRKKLKIEGRPDPIITKRGFGYLLSSSES